MKNFMVGLAILGVWVCAMTLVGCDEKKFQADHPEEAQVIEMVVDGVEGVAATVVESELHIPSGTLKPVFDHNVFDEPAPK